MSRSTVRGMKRVFAAGHNDGADEGARVAAASAALALLERSVRMHHHRLAVKRLAAAISLGVHVPDGHWRYCRAAADKSMDDEVRDLFIRTALAASEKQHQLGASSHG